MRWLWTISTHSHGTSRTRPSTCSQITHTILRTRALDLQTANELAGSFEGAFFQGSVAQQSLVEPTIRHAIGTDVIVPSRTGTEVSWPERLNIFYNRAISALLQRFETEQISISLTAMANVLFTCFEYFRGKLTAARTHVKSGINLLNSWRQNTRAISNKPLRRITVPLNRIL